MQSDSWDHGAMPVGPKRPKDPNQAAKMLIDIVSGEVEDTLSAAKKATPDGRRAGGLRGGKARAQSLTKAQREDIARVAASARWKKS